MIASLISLTLLAAAPAVQDRDAPAATARVGYGDLNLHTIAGRTALDRRLRRAVRTVCPAPDHRELIRVQAAKNCHAIATASANQQRQVALASVGAVQVGTVSGTR